MLTLVLKRLASAAVIVVVLAAVVFGLQQLSPLDPVHAMLGGQASQDAIAAQRVKLGLDRPVAEQFVDYLTGLPTGDLGSSYRTRRPVSTDLTTYLPATAELALSALIVALALGVLLAASVSLRWKGAALVKGFLLAASSTPAFLLGLALILVFYKQLGWLPATGRTSLADAPDSPTGLLTIDALLHGRFDAFADAVKHLVLPSIALAVGPAVAIGRVLASSILGETDAVYARTARAQGLTEAQVLRRHVLRNSLGPALSMTGLQLGLMFAGVLVIEQIFAWPGLGSYVAQSIPQADFPAIAGVTLLLGAGYVLINTVVDLLQAAADPRISV
ncbi:MAG: ABC transporter permease [Kineosporiaceae bacterium]